MSALAFDPRAYLDTLRREGDPAKAALAANRGAAPMQSSNVVVLAELRAAMEARAPALDGIVDAAREDEGGPLEPPDHEANT